LTSILKPYVGQVIEAADGEIGLAKAREYKPSLIISDWNMPKMSGFELLQAVKSDEELKWTPVILLTARAGEGERVEGLLTGAEVSALIHREEIPSNKPIPQDYMTKPFQSRELVARVSLQVQLGKRRKILEEAFATRLEEVEKRREAAEMERKRQELLIDVTSLVAKGFVSCRRF
jgi:DNA-binding response OmpR family regulator